MKKEYNMRELSEIWLKYKEKSIKDTSKMQYERIINNYIDVYLGEVLLSELSIMTILEFIDQIDKDISKKTMQDIIVVLKSILNYGNLIQECHLPLQAIPTIKLKKREIKVFSSHDLDVLEKYLREHICHKNLGLLICLYTGMRLGEICALRWEDIYLDERKISINKTVYRVTEKGRSLKKIGMPKTEQSVREIPINEALFDILKNNIQQEGYIITGNEHFLDTRTFQYYFKKVLKQLDIEGYHFHCMRHTFATRCIQCEVDVKSLSEILGHSSVNITLNNYVHSSFDIKKMQINKLKL